eukprot:scaffold808_cov180-Ochromonas_danica.AAC.2
MNRLSNSVLHKSSQLLRSTTSIQKSYQASILELFLLGMLVFGKVFTYWQSAFNMGYWEFVLAAFMVSTGYLTFVGSIAEMTSILPFSGGSYGYVRCVLGPLIGYMIGFFEAMEYVMFVATSLDAVGRVISAITGTARNAEPIYWLFFYTICLPLHILGGSAFWKVGAVLAVWIVILVLVYLLGNAGGAVLKEDHTGDVAQLDPEALSFLRYFPMAGWCYKGIEVMTLTCDNIRNPGYIVPRTMMATIVAMVIFFIGIVFMTGSVHPGAFNLINESFPLDPGLMKIFHVNKQTAAFIAAPTMIGTTFCFIYAAAHQLYAMACSGLFSPMLKEVYGRNRTPWVAILLVALVSYVVQVTLFYWVPDSYVDILFTLSMMSSQPVYICLCISYLIYTTTFSSLERSFYSPFGRVGACYALLLYCFVSVSLVGFPKEVTVSSSLFCISSVLALAYYYFVAAKRQFFSKEEQQKFLKIYVIKANKGKHKRGKHGNNKRNAVTPSEATRPSEQVSSSHHEESTGVRGGVMGLLGAVPNMFGYLMRAQLDAEMLQSVGPESGLSSPDHVSGGGAMTAAAGGKVLPEVPHHPTDTSDYQYRLSSPSRHQQVLSHDQHQPQNGESEHQGMDQSIVRDGVNVVCQHPVEETHTQRS